MACSFSDICHVAPVSAVRYAYHSLVVLCGDRISVIFQRAEISEDKVVPGTGSVVELIRSPNQGKLTPIAVLPPPPPSLSTH